MTSLEDEIPGWSKKLALFFHRKLPWYPKRSRVRCGDYTHSVGFLTDSMRRSRFNAPQLPIRPLHALEC